MTVEKTRIGLIGAGVMGVPMGLNLIKTGYELNVWARRPETAQPLREAGAAVATTPADLARDSEIILVMLPDLPQLRTLLDGPDGLLAGVEREIVLVISSTVSPTAVVALAAELSERTNGLLSVVDAPVSGGEQGAAAGSLSIMVGGDQANVAKVMPALRACGNPVHLGPLGAGSVGKACNQMIVAATTAALAEASVLAERSGLDVGALLDLLKGGYAGSRLLDLKRDRFVNHDHSPSGAAKYMVKDLGFAMDQAVSVHAATPITRTLRSLFSDLTDAGMGDSDTAVVQAWIESLDS